MVADDYSALQPHEAGTNKGTVSPVTYTVMENYKMQKLLQTPVVWNCSLQKVKPIQPKCASCYNW